MGAVERNCARISQSPGIPEQRQKRRVIHSEPSFRWQRWLPGRDQGCLFDGLNMMTTTTIYYVVVEIP